MTLTFAEECIRKIKLKAAEVGVDVSIAVVDDAGSLVAYARTGEKRDVFKAQLILKTSRILVRGGSWASATPSASISILTLDSIPTSLKGTSTPPQAAGYAARLL